MNYDQYGVCWTDTDELFEMLYENPELDLGAFCVRDTPFSSDQYNKAVDQTYSDLPKLQLLREINIPIEDFDKLQQLNWYMPDEYKNMNIVQWILDQCKTQEELQRVGEELLLYADRDLFELLRYLKYFVDTMRLNKVVWGVGRGSSTASYVLYLIGVHKINSLYYDLPIKEFLK
jgi:hypothetical protein